MPDPDASLAAPHSATTVFISYSHRNRYWLDRLRVHLAPVERTRRIVLWDDTRIVVGSEWRREIEAAINDARVAILIISADFMASDFIAQNELPPLLAAASARGLTVVPVIVSATGRFDSESELWSLQAFNAPSTPLNTLSEADQEVELARLATMVESLVTPRPMTADREIARVEVAPPANKGANGVTHDQVPVDTTAIEELASIIRAYGRPHVWLLAAVLVVTPVLGLVPLLPAWPPGLALLAFAIQAVVVIACFDASLRTPAADLRRALRRQAVLAVLTVLGYSCLLWVFTFAKPWTGGWREAKGLIFTADASAMYRAGHTSSKELLSEFNWQADRVWVSWTVDLVSIGIAATYLATLGIVTVLASTFVLEQRSREGQ